MKSNIGTIIKKECSRFFGDKTMFFTNVIMPGFLIYIIYSLMGDFFMKSDVDEEPTIVYVENMSETMRPILETLPYKYVTSDFNATSIKSDLSKKEQNYVFLAFPAQFDSIINAYSSDSVHASSNVSIFYNSTSDKSKEAYYLLSETLNHWEEGVCNLFNINEITKENLRYDMASDEDVIRNYFGELIPLLMLMMVFSGCMAIVPASIAGEKERGTLATLLVTPLKRSELALGKVLSVTLFTMLSGLSCFVGMMLSLPKLIHADELGLSTSMYQTSDYVALLLIILSTVLVITSLSSILSAKVTSVKAASSLMVPLMVICLFVGMLPMMMSDISNAPYLFLIPVFNSVQSMAMALEQEMTATILLITLISNCLYALGLVWVLTKMFNSEKVMFSK
ncbi:MAG: ABC transporter permease [Bacteroidales bacterium]|nr:ABC transporter permease [Bacteroidales bacterium]